jgi:hypothetical protein
VFGPYLSILFIGATAVTVFYLLRSAAKVGLLSGVLLAWLVVQAVLAETGFFLDTLSMPPRMLAAIGPPLLTLLVLLALPAGRGWLCHLDLRMLTMLHVVRVPVEIGLHGLFLEGAVPQVMTYEGRNFDIFSGLTAPVVSILAFSNGRVNIPLLLGWNILCLLLVFNIMVHGILSVPTPFQQFGFEQPNRGLLYFPYQWLPALIVPVVVMAHVASILQVLRLRARGQAPA